MMKTLYDMRDHLVKELKLDKSRVFAWSDDGALRYTAGSENQSFMADYVGNIAITDCSAPLDHVFLVVSNFMSVRQPHNAGAKPVRFDVELLRRDLANVFLSLPISEVINTTQVMGGTSLDALTVPPPVLPEDPVTADITAQHVPGGNPDVGPQ